MANRFIPYLPYLLPIEVVLQDHGRRRGIELCLSPPPVGLVPGEPAVGFPARQPLIHSRDRHARPRRERRDERRGTRRLVAGRSVESCRQTHDDRRQSILFGAEPLDFDQHARHRIGAAVHGQRLERTGERLRRIADCEPDTAGADIDSKYAHLAAAIPRVSNPQPTRCGSRRRTGDAGTAAGAGTGGAARLLTQAPGLQPLLKSLDVSCSRRRPGGRPVTMAPAA